MGINTKNLLTTLITLIVLISTSFAQDTIKTFTLEGAYLYTIPDYSARTDSEFFIGTDIYITKYEEGFYKIAGGYVRAAKVYLTDKLKAYNKSLGISVHSQHFGETQEYKLRIGMTEDEVRKILGSPNEIHNITTSNDHFEQWIYDKKYLYFKNGKLYEIQG